MSNRQSSQLEDNRKRASQLSDSKRPQKMNTERRLGSKNSLSPRTARIPENESERDISRDISIDFGLDEKGLQYSNLIAANVVEKLKISLGIPTDKISHQKLQEFFVEKFAGPENPEFFHNMPDRKRLEIVDEKVFGYVKPEDSITKRDKASRQARKLKEQMVGYADAIIER